MKANEIAAIANATIPAFDNKKVLIKKGDTQDIVNEVIQCFKDSRMQVCKLAPHFKGKTLNETLNNVWKFWKYNIAYNQDPQGVQWVQEPKALWGRKSGDCKSLSVAVMSTLSCLGIKASFRFATYSPANTQPTHVYVVVLNNGKEIPVDCVWKEFGTEKPYSKKWDYNMTSIYRIAGLNDNVGKLRFAKRLFAKPIARKAAKKARRRGVLDLPVNDEPVTQAEVDIALQKQKLELEQIQSEKVNGIGGLHDNSYEFEIMALDNAQYEISGGKRGKRRRFAAYIPPVPVHDRQDEVGFLGLSKKDKARKLEKAKAANAAGKAVNKKQANKLEKLNIAVVKRKEGLLKRVAQGIKKVITTPVRLALKTQLPKNGSFFLYTFITDPKVIAKLPEAVAMKRNKALEMKRTVVEKLQMKESNFNQAVRNGIQQAFGGTPEVVLAKWMADANFSIGVIPFLAIAAGGIQKLLGAAGANIQANLEAYAPAPEDWTGVTNITDIQNGILQQPTNNDLYQGNGSVPPTTEDYKYDTYAGNGYSGYDYNRQYSPDNAYGDLNNEKTLDNVTVTATRPKTVEDEIDLDPPATQSTINYMPWVIGAAVAAVAFGSKGTRKKAS